MTPAEGIVPPLLWSALGLDIVRGQLLVAEYDGESLRSEHALAGHELEPWLDVQVRAGVDLIATPAALPVSLDGSAADLVFPLNEWSMVLGIHPPLVGPDRGSISRRLGLVYEHLIQLDPSILRSAIGLPRGNTGESRLLASALANSQAAHPGTSPPMELMFLTNRPRPERLKARRNGEPVDPRATAEMFASDGPVASHYIAWEERPQQTQLARAVATILATGGETITEAGTGTGKSLAYLVPALMHAIGTGEQVVVATNTRVLQDQLATKDAPVAVDAIKHVLPESEPRVHVLKGRGNYLCLRRWFAEPQASNDPAESTFRTRATIWLAVTESGDRSELALDRESARAFDRISAEGEACDASRCQFQQRNQCFLYRARRSADAAHVVVTNHALLLTDVVQGGDALPEARHLIIDEAHHLEDQATSSFQTAVSMRIISLALNQLVPDGRRPSGPGLLVEIDSFFGGPAMRHVGDEERRAIRETVGAANRAVDAVRASATGLFSDFALVVADQGEHARDYASRCRITPGIRNGSAWSEIERKWDALNLAMVGLTSNLQELQSYLPEVTSVNVDAADAEKLLLRVEDLENRLGVARHNVIEINLQLNEAIHNPIGRNVYWLESRSNDSATTTIFTAPVQLDDYLRQHLYNRLDSLVLTSATMTIGGSTEFIRKRLGLPDADELQVDSPFDYERNALLILPSDVPEPNVAGFDRASHEAIFQTAAAAHGRTLVLFTSLAAMNSARVALAERFAAERLSLLTQHEDGSAEQLAEQLRSFDRTVVFGAGAFWEGVDVPGPALSALVITKLPFAVPTDPIVAARSETFENAFMDYSLPQATLKVRQGFGRLIRSKTDRGVCVLLDRRVTSKRYGRLILDTLPRTRREYGTIAQIGSTVSQFLGEQTP
jgi:DNA polymerase-3 subunit epsilon/ATP-dependent DNA helicase DinG